MDILGGHLLFDQATRRLFAGPYTEDSFADDTPSKEPEQKAPPRPAPVKPHPNGIPHPPDVPMLMEPQSLQVQRQPLMPGEMPAEFLPGENGRPVAPLDNLMDRTLSRI
jgi:hypothetical protein